MALNLTIMYYLIHSSIKPMMYVGTFSKTSCLGVKVDALAFITVIDHIV